MDGAEEPPGASRLVDERAERVNARSKEISEDSSIVGMLHIYTYIFAYLCIKYGVLC